MLVAVFVMSVGSAVFGVPTADREAAGGLGAGICTDPYSKLF